MKVLRWTGVGLLLAFVFAGSVRGAERLAPAPEWMPGGALLAIEVTGADDVLDLIISDEMIDTIASMPGMQAAKRIEISDEVKKPTGLRELKQAVAFYQGRTGTDWKTAVDKLFGGGATLAVYPDESVLLVVDSLDAKLLEETRDFFTLIAKGEAEKVGDGERISSGEYRGVTGWTFGPKEAHAVIGNRLVLTNDVERLKSVVDLREDGGSSLAAQAEFKTAKQAAGPDADVVVMVNMAMLNQHPPVQQALAGTENPFGSLLLAGVAESLRSSNVVTVGLDVSAGEVTVDIVADGEAQSEDSTLAFAQVEDSGALPNLKVPGFLAGFSFYRDLHGFYAAKDELFPERTSQLIFFENMMGIFFSGRDLTDEVLAETEPEIRFLVTQQQYDQKIGTPKTQIPAFALVARLKDPEKFSVVVEEAWQKAIGLVNFTRGQNAEPGLIIDRPTHGETQFTVARFAAPKVEERTDADVRFNFNPAVAMPDGYLILSSTEGLARDLIDAVSAEASETLAGIEDVHSLVELDGANLASILKINREQLIRNNMVEEGHTRSQAEIAIDTLLAIVSRIGEAKFEISDHSGATRARFVMELKLADGG